MRLRFGALLALALLARPASAYVEALYTLPRVIKAKDLPWEGGPGHWNKDVLRPSMEPFRTQTLEIHIESEAPGGISHVACASVPSVALRPTPAPKKARNPPTGRVPRS